MTDFFGSRLNIPLKGTALGRLDVVRRELGGTGLGTESDTLLVCFALAYSLSSSGIAWKVKQIALWGVAIPAGIVIMLYLSKGAVLLLFVTAVFYLIFSDRRRAAI